MKCIFTDTAEADIEAIADYIAYDSPALAVAFIRKLRTRCEDITKVPEGYPVLFRVW